MRLSSISTIPARLNAHALQIRREVPLRPVVPSSHRQINAYSHAHIVHSRTPYDDRTPFLFSTLETRRVQSLTNSCPLRQLMHSLPIPSHLLIKHEVFIPRQHFLFSRHLRLPPRNQLDRLLLLRLFRQQLHRKRRRRRILHYWRRHEFAFFRPSPMPLLCN